MKVIIQKDTKKLGKAGETIEVSDGYAVNFLIPNKIVLPTHQGNEKVIAENMRQEVQKQALIKKKAVQLAQKIKQQTITLKAKSGDKGKIFGNITKLQITEAINREIDQINLEHHQVTIKEPITQLGQHTVILHLHPKVQTEIVIEVK